jgi:N-methylhydantoinase A/oxoprolinase/acetone carboxylase beta subunit
MVKPDPPASLADMREAVERMDARGTTLVPVDTEQVESIVRDLVESGVESLTIALINSYVDGAHERRIGEIVERLCPGEERLPTHPRSRARGRARCGECTFTGPSSMTGAVERSNTSFRRQRSRRAGT